MNMSQAMEAFVKISKYAGSRFDLSQAGGGNSSVKLDDGAMIIKASGLYLGDVTQDSCFCVVDINEVNKILQRPDLDSLDKSTLDALTSEALQKTVREGKGRPSIETFLHARLKKITLHIHPIAVNAILYKKTWREEIMKLFPTAICINYFTPGGELALRLFQTEGIDSSSLIFLQNHGVIFTANSVDEILNMVEKVCLKCEQFIGADLSRFKKTTMINEKILELTGRNVISTLSDDSAFQSLLIDSAIKPLCPDDVVYWGQSILHAKRSLNVEIEDYFMKYQDIPRVIIHDAYIYFVGLTLNKCYGIVDQLKAHILSRQAGKDHLNELLQDEMNYLSHWEAEKYRQKI